MSGLYLILHGKQTPLTPWCLITSAFLVMKKRGDREEEKKGGRGTSADLWTLIQKYDNAPYLSNFKSRFSKEIGGLMRKNTRSSV